MWRHLRLLKRGGRAHDPTGVQGTASGELAVLCPACPHPNINLPSGWKLAAKSSECAFNFALQPEYLYVSRYLYYQSFGIDACFRFKRRQISSYEKDPELGPGFAYVVAWEPYQRYLQKSGNQNEVSDFLFVLDFISQRFTDQHVFWVICHRACKFEVLQRLFYDWSCMHNMQP